MRANRMPEQPSEPSDEPEDERAKMVPPIPRSGIRKIAHRADARKMVEQDAHKDFGSYGPHRARAKEAKTTLARCERAKSSREKTLEVDLDKRDRVSTIYSRRLSSLREAITFSNLPTIAGLTIAGGCAVGLFCTELLSATLLMWNSGWGLTENIFLMAAIVATWVIQPFFVTKFLVAVMPSKIAIRIQRSISAVGFPLAFVGFWALAMTLGPMADAPEFSMIAVDVASDTVEPEPLSKSMYLLLAMISMWSGTYSAFYIANHLLDELWPVTAVERSEYSVLTKRIEKSESEIAYYDEKIVASREALATEDLLEAYFVERCITYLEEAQEELKTLQDAVRLSPFTAAPSLN